MTVTSPTGAKRELTLSESEPGTWRSTLPANDVFHGDGWMGVKMRDASVARGVGVLPLFAGLIGLLLLLGALAATRLREGADQSTSPGVAQITQCL